MNIYSIFSTAHRDEADESAPLEIFYTHKGSAIYWYRETVKQHPNEETILRLHRVQTVSKSTVVAMLNNDILPNGRPWAVVETLASHNLAPEEE